MTVVRPRGRSLLWAMADHLRTRCKLQVRLRSALASGSGVYPNKGTKCDIGLSLISDAHDCGSISIKVPKVPQDLATLYARLSGQVAAV